MSGSTIGGIVGGVVGWFVGGPAGAQWGFMIGSAVGAIVAPEQFEGPRLAEAKTQTANDGVPLIYGYGTFPCSGNLAWVDEVKEHKKTESQKGGPEVTTYTYTVSYMIVVCQGEISGYKLIKRNGKIVYDARTDAELSALGYSSNEIAETRANQASFLQRATLYYGTQTQMPDPTMVAVEGAGNVPAYTGIAYIVLKDDETREGEVSQYEFVVANCGERHESGAEIFGQILVTGVGTGSTPTPFIAADAAVVPVFEGIPQSTGANISAACCGVSADGMWIAVGNNNIRYSTDILNEWHSADSAWSNTSGRFAVHGSSGWLIQYANSNLSRASRAPTDADQYQINVDGGGTYGEANITVFEGGRYITSFRYYGDRVFLATDDLDTSWDYRQAAISDVGSIRLISDVLVIGADTYICCWVAGGGGGLDTIGNDIRLSTDGGASFNELLYRDTNGAGKQPNHLCAGNGAVIAVSLDCSTVYTSADGFSSAWPTGVYRSPTGPQWGNENNGRSVAFSGGRFFVIGAAGVVSSANGMTWSEVAPYPPGFTNPRSIAATSRHYGEPIPDAPGYYIDPLTGDIIGPPGTQIDPCQPSLGQIVADQCERRGVISRDVSELTDPVGGYRVAAPSTPQRNIQGLQPGYFFSASEFDGTLHFPKRGRALTFALTQDDFVERDGDPIQWERTQEPELLRKVTVGYVDPETTYTATTQMAERRAATISAEGESTIELAVTGSKDWAAQAADKSMKVAWGEPDECTFHVSIEHAELVTGAEGIVPYTDGTSTAIRIDRIEDEGLVRMVTGRRTRANLYQSNAAGIAKQLPRFPGSNIRGPADGLLINMPVLLDGNDVPGIYWAAAGVMSGYIGATLQILSAGEWVTAGQATGNATMGSLLSPLPSHANDVDFENVLHIRINGDLESVTFHNLLSERNPLAIIRTDGTAEVVQFQTATEIAAGEYELTTLIRGRLDTGVSSHGVGARVVFLDDSVNYAAIDPSSLGQMLTYRFVSVGTDPDAAPILTYPLITMESQREWQPYNATYEADADNWTVRFIGRHRLGTDQFPVASSHFMGWRIDFTIGATTHSHLVQSQEWTYTEAQQIADWGSAQSGFDAVTVTAINQYTNGDGAGGSGSGTTAIQL